MFQNSYPGRPFQELLQVGAAPHAVKFDACVLRAQNYFPGEGQRASEAALQMEGSGREDSVRVAGQRQRVRG